MPPTDIAELRRLHEAATTGKWFAFRLSVASTSVLVGDIVCQPPDEDCEESLKQWPHNADYISAVRNALPALLDELEELREEITELRLKHSRLRHIHAEAVTLLAGVVNSGDISTAAKMLVSSISNIEDAKQLLDARDRRMKLTGAAQELGRSAKTLREDLADMNPPEFASRGKVAPGYCECLQDVADGMEERAAQLRREAEDGK